MIDNGRQTAVKHPFLLGGGEMGEQIRDKNWQLASIGDPSVWPQSLRTTLSIILHSDIPMLLCWGQELICFYNDAYRPSLGNNGKHPSILGMRAKDAWPEIWDTVSPLIDTVLQQGISVRQENQLIPIFRNGQSEDVYWTFSYSPVHDESGIPAGVLITCTEITDSIQSIKKLKESKDELAFAVEATELGTFDYNPITNKFSSNQQLKHWFGLSPTEEVVLDNAISAIAPEDRKRVSSAIWKTLDYQSGGRYDIEYKIIHPETGDETYVRAKGRAWFNHENIPYRLNGTLQDITVQYVARKEMEESEQRLRSLVASAPFPIAVYAGREMRIALANQSIIDIWGKGNDVIGKLYTEILPELQNQEVFEQVQKVFDTGIPFHAKNRHIDIVIDGKLQPYYFNYSFTPLYDAKGTVYGVMNTGSDVTDLNVAKQQVEESEERQQIVIEASELGTWEFNLQTDEVIYSDRYSEIFGHQKNATKTYKQLFEQLYPSDLPVRNAAFQEALATGHLHYESRIIRPDHSIHWMEVKGKVFYTEDRKPWKILGTVRDNTAEKNYQQSLLEREEKFRLLADAMPQLVWTSDASGQLIYFNESFYTHTGLPPGINLNDAWLEAIFPDERNAYSNSWMESVTDGKHFSFEHRLRGLDGGYRWQLSRAIPQKDREGNTRMWVGTSTDIHEMKELDAQKDYFISMASHELKTPVTSIKGYIQVLQQKYRDAQDDFLTHALSVADRQIVTLTKLITDLLDLSKIKTGNLSFNYEYFELDNLVENIISEITNIHAGYQVTFISKTHQIVYADKERIGQVLINFLTNAIKYSPVKKQINVNGLVDNGDVKVTVEDQGIGIQKNDQEKIFDRFYRAGGESGKTFPGFGIGLFIAADIIKRHNGNIGVNSEPGKGSEFYFSLPLEK